MDKFSEISSHPKMAELDQLVEQEKALSTSIKSMEFADPRIERSFIEAHQIAVDGINSLRNEPGVNEEIIAINRSSSQGLTQLDALRDITGQGDDEDAREEMLDRLAVTSRLLSGQYQDGTPDLKAQADLSQSSRESVAEGAVEAGVGSSSVEQEKPAKELTLTISKKSVKISSGGQLVLFDKRTNEEHHNYGPARRAALIYIVDNQDREVSPSEIWDGICGEIGLEGTTLAESGQETMNNIKTWLRESATYYNSPIIEHNGLRGPGSRYKVSDRFILKSRLKVTPNTQKDISQDPVSLDGIGGLTPEKFKVPEYESIIASRDILLVAVRMGVIKDALLGYDFKALDPEITAGLKEATDELDRQANEIRVRTSDAQLALERQNAIQNTVDAINDSDKMMDYIDMIDAGSPQEQFVDYFSMLEEEELKILQKLILARSETHGVTDYDARNISQAKTVLYDAQTGEQLWPLPKASTFDPQLHKGRTETEDTGMTDIDVDETEAEQQGSSDEQHRPTEFIDRESQDSAVDTPSEEERTADDDIEIKIRGHESVPVEDNALEDSITIERSLTYIDEHGAEQPDRRNPQKSESRLEFEGAIKSKIVQFAQSLKHHMADTTLESMFSHGQIVSVPGLDGRTASEALASNLLSISEREVNKIYTLKDVFLIHAFKISHGRKFSVTEKRWSKVIDRTIDEVIATTFTK